MRVNKTKRKLAAGAVVFGSMVNIPSPGVVELLGYAGLDFVILNTEHGPMDLAVTENMIRAAEGAGIDALVRLRRIDAGDIARYLDMGASGIQVPHVHTAADLQTAVHAAKYPQQGTRPLVSARGGLSATPQSEGQRMSSSNRETMVVCKIGSGQAVENISELLSVEDVDVFFVGPADLSQTLGYPGQERHPVVTEAKNRVIEQTVAAGKRAGVTTADLQADIVRGACYVMAPDFRLLMDGARAYLGEGRRLEQSLKNAGRTS